MRRACDGKFRGVSRSRQKQTSVLVCVCVCVTAHDLIPDFNSLIVIQIIQRGGKKKKERIYYKSILGVLIVMYNAWTKAGSLLIIFHLHTGMNAAMHGAVCQEHMCI